MDKREMPEKDFTKAAKTASECGCLKRRNGEFGTIFGIFLNDNLVMSSNVLEDGIRHYYSHLD